MLICKRRAHLSTLGCDGEPYEQRCDEGSRRSSRLRVPEREGTPKDGDIGLAIRP